MSMRKIPPDDILEGLYKLRIRESDKLKTVLELYDLETHQKKLGPDYHRLKAMVKRSIEQEIRNKNFGARSGNFEKKRRGQESGDKTAWPGGWGPQGMRLNRRRRTREGPEPACVQTPLVPGWHTQGGKDELTSCRGTV